MRRLLPAIALLVILPAPAAAQSVDICHATGAGSFVALTVGADELAVHAGHEEDVIPAPSGGCAGAGQGEVVDPATTPAATPTPVYEVPEPTVTAAPETRQEDRVPPPRPISDPEVPAPAPRGGVAPRRGVPPMTRRFPVSVRGPVPRLSDTGAEAWLLALLGCGLLCGGVGLRLRLRGLGV